MANKNYLVQVGETTDNKKVVAGVWKTFETHGLPLDIIFTLCIRKNYVPDWVALYKEMKASGMQHDRALSKLEEAICDSYGKEFSDKITSTLESIYHA